MENQGQSDLSGPWLKRWVFSQKMSIILMLIFAAIGIGFTLIQPIPFKLLADNVFGGQELPSYLSWFNGDAKQLLLLVVVGNLLLFGFGALFEFVSGVVQQKIEARLDLAVQREILGCILVLPYNEPGRMQNGEYLYRLSGLYTAVADFVYGTVITVIRSVAMMLGMTVVLLTMNPMLALIAFAAMPLLYFSTHVFSKKLEKQSTVVTEYEDKIYAASSETVENVRMVQAYNKEAVQLNRFLRLTSSRNKESVRLTILGNFFGTTNSLINTVATTLVILVGGSFVFSGRLSFGALLVFTSYMGNLLEPLQSLSSAIAGWKTQRAQISKLHDVIAVSDRWRMDSGPLQPEGLRGEISLENVSLYRGDNPVLLDVTYTIPAGQKVAIIGPSGTGKSTLFNILLRFLTPSAGQVKIDGVELHQFNLGYLRRKIALVDQMPQLISATVSENIAFSTLDEQPVNAQAVADSAEKAGAIEFIQQLENQFAEELAIGSDHDLSGGQKQRLAIARAFYKDAPIMLFDEPTSALDEASRNKVTDAIRNIHGKTIVLVTHDMSVLAAVDKILVLHDHKLVPVEELGGLDAYKHNLEQEGGDMDSSYGDEELALDSFQQAPGEPITGTEQATTEATSSTALQTPAQPTVQGPVESEKTVEIKLH